MVWIVVIGIEDDQNSRDPDPGLKSLQDGAFDLSREDHPISLDPEGTGDLSLGMPQIDHQPAEEDRNPFYLGLPFDDG